MVFIKRYRYLLVLLLLFFAVNKSSSQVKDSIAGGRGINRIEGIWEGSLDGRDTLIMVMKVSGESGIYGYSIFKSDDSKVEIYEGKAGRDNTITLKEPDGPSNGTFILTLKGEKLSGEWMPYDTGKKKQCSLKLKSKLIIPKIKPDIFINLLLENISKYADSQDDKYLSNVYNSWYTPAISLNKTFREFEKDFSMTIVDSLISSETDDRGAFAIVQALHDVTDYNAQFTDFNSWRYNTKYVLINLNGSWKILRSGVIEYKKLEKQVNITLLLNTRLEITELNPKIAQKGDTVTVKIRTDFDLTNISNLKIYFGEKEGSIIARERYLLSAIVPDISSDNYIPVTIRLNDKVLASYEQFKTLSEEKSIPWYVYLLAGIAAVIIAVIIYGNYRLSKEKENLSRESTILTEEKHKLTAEKEVLLQNISQKTGTGSEIKITLPQPNVPQELIDACKKRECVLYTGSEIAVQAGFPDWYQFVYDLLSWSIENKYIEDESIINSLRTSLENGFVSRTADSIIFSLEKKNVDLNDYLNKMFIQQKPEIPGIYRVIKSTNFSAILSTTFDQTIERAYDNQLNIYTYKDIEKLQESVSNNSMFLLKIYGDITKPDTVLVSPSRFDNEMLRNLQFSQFIETLFYSRSIFFIGEDIEGMESFLNSVKFRGFRSRPHFALVGVKTHGWQTSAQVMEEKFGIKVIPYEYGNNEQLAKFISDLSFSSPNTEEADTKEKKYSVIKKVKLKNIGPFENLELTFDRYWNVLLGDNGVGKSTILKAIAMVICGSDAASYAYRLIKSGQSEGTIILETEDIFEDNNEEILSGNGKAYIAKIYDRGGDKSEIERYVRPLDSEGWLVLAFPPLRTVTWNRPAGPQPDGSKISVSEDILPILAGETDPRMDKLKQWVVNQFFKSVDTNKSEEERYIYKKQLDMFTKVIDDLTPNLIVQDLTINTDNFKVTIRTEDGMIPIESISQGTLSLISWVGILIQRLYEVYGETENPLLQHAKVIMDEIDAHMHPSWQQTLVNNLKLIFPNIQFIVSTHSPFVVGGMNPEQVFKFGRDDSGNINQTKVLAEDLHGRIDQIITSPLFGLEYARDNYTKILMQKYNELTTKIELTDEEENELKNLSEKLNKTVLLPQEKKEARTAFKLIQENLQDKLKTLDDTERKKILHEMEIQIQEGISKFKK